VTGYQLDETDWAIINLLREDGRAPFAKIGAAVDLSPDAARVRLSRLTADGIVRVIGIVHPSSLGYEALSAVVVDYSGAFPTLVEELRRYSEVTFMALMLGEHNVLCEIVARDDRALQEFLNGVLRQIDGVDRVEPWRILDVVKWAVQGRPSPPQTAIAAGAESPVVLDELDMQILRVLTEAPRLSYRELEERVGAPYSIVRRRAQSLFASGTIVATVVVDVVTANPRIMAQVCLKLGAGGAAALEKLAESEEVHILIRLSGRYNALAEVACDSHEHLVRVIDQMLALKGVESAVCYLVTHYSILPTPWALRRHERSAIAAADGHAARSRRH
jgi:DNA-binding Lrp family transcriptional regulator